MDDLTFSPYSGTRNVLDQEAAPTNKSNSRANQMSVSQQFIRAKLEQYASNVTNGITNNNIVFETKIKIIDILQVQIKIKFF